MQEELVSEAVEELGLSSADIALILISLLVILSLLFSFIFFAIKAYNNTSSFDSVIQSLLVSGSGSVAQVRSHSRLALYRTSR